MIDWIGHLIASWPFWLVVALTIIVWFMYNFLGTVAYWPRKHEWEEDRQKRVAKELEKIKAKTALKAKKG